ncbi:unnamed protein product [Strongylus vulgaris]|uniref:glucuronosyltransferase n=1 Tax=Strongylus vulgaris TaxID=40348 RepID=A0A3P7HZH3_STRVU|nr:unnamed protein product [Strongylus vulgaris]
MFDVCSVGLVYEAKIPAWIWLNSGSIMDYIAYRIGVPIIPSYVPRFLLEIIFLAMMMEAGAEMSFLKRVKSVIGHGLTNLIWTKLVADPETQLFRTFVSPDFPDLIDLAAKCPLIMANTNDLYELPRPTLAKIVNIGGVGMVSEEKPLNEVLSKSILDIIDRSDGVVLFSFGSVAPMWKMPTSWKKMFMAAFQRFPTYQFLLRYEKDDINDILPPNVHLFKWMPQSDLLRHPKTKAFITHGGYNSFQEAVHTGVPCITIPLFGDQSKNALLAEHHGFSLVLRKGELSKEIIYSALKEIISNPRYKEAASRLSRMVKQQPVNPTELLVRWSEFVAEFQTLENLAPFGTKLNFIQYHSLDVIAFLLTVAILVLILAIKLLKFILKLLWSILSQLKKEKAA